MSVHYYLYRQVTETHAFEPIYSNKKVRYPLFNHMPLSQMKVVVFDDASVRLFSWRNKYMYYFSACVCLYSCKNKCINAWITFYVCVCILGGIKTSKSNKYAMTGNWSKSEPKSRSHNRNRVIP